MRALALLALVLATPLAAQGYRARVDGRFQSVSFRGLQLDSIPVADTVTGPYGGPQTADGFAVHCPPSASHCLFFRPGAIQHGAPFVTSADVSLWGFGIRGVSAHVNARAATDLSGSAAWPGTEPALQLVTAYVEYNVERLTARAGRQLNSTRLGMIGFDGASLALRDNRHGLDAAIYGGWGLARGVALPVTSPALNPLDDFQPSERQLLIGGAAGWSGRAGDVRAEYLREVDPRTDYFVSERVGLSAVIRPAARWNVTGGADYDIAAGWWGSAEATVGYATPAVTGSVGVRRYRPHFDLWTIWGMFSPVPYKAVQGQVAVRALKHVQLRGRGEAYRFDPDYAETPLVNVEESGWRAELGGTGWLGTSWTVDAGYHYQYGPGAASAGTSASVTFEPPNHSYAITAHGAYMDRPLEMRFSDSQLRFYGIDGRIEPRPDMRLELGAVHYAEDRSRPDAAAMDWGQWRVTLRAVFAFGSGEDLGHLPPAIRRMPGGRAQR
ncbi:MAG TPA: hypothetical protein VL263_18670 [Vicinamibacterales bacterium]|nr:hypothetical protein [Vicinamibacterales bacterium]